MILIFGFTLCSGIICEELNGEDYAAVLLKTDEVMTIGYIVRKGVPISMIGKEYLAELAEYKKYTL